MPSTRVYVDIVEKEEKVEIQFKNVSEEQLNFNTEEIVERFVRGDKSRHTSGSGLGLAIVKSFTEAQNGNFKIETDGDLFKAIVVLPKHVEKNRINEKESSKLSSFSFYSVSIVYEVRYNIRY